MGNMAQNGYHEIAQGVMDDGNSMDTLLQRHENGEQLSPEEYTQLISYMEEMGSERGADTIRLKSDPETFKNTLYENASPEEQAYIDNLSPEDLDALMQNIAESDGLGSVSHFMNE